ncbi:unnamed protein product [Callosobruchus maculatus]|nr:unnamed protein product [Callosobruchus maculatus]
MDMATEQEIVSDNEENDDLQEPTEHTENVFDQLLPSSSGAPGHSTSETQELPEDIQERIRQNKERAERIRLERLQRARDQAAISLPGSNRLSSSQHQNEDVNEDLFSNQTNDQKEEETIEDLLDEINSQKGSTGKPEKNKSSGVCSDEEIDQDEVIEKNKSPSTNKKASAMLSGLESSEDEASEPEKGQKRTNGGLVNGINEQEFEVKTKKRKVKVIDSDSDSEMNSQVTHSKMMSNDEDVNSAVEERNRRGLDAEKAKKRGRVIDSDDENQTEGTIDELLNELNTTEGLDKENGQNFESDENIEGDSRRENKHGYRKKLRTIESDEEESEPFSNNSSDFKDKKTEGSQHTKHIESSSDSEESDNENNINKGNVNKATQDIDQTSNYVADNIQDTKPNSQSMSQNEDRKNDHNGHADISNETDD